MLAASPFPESSGDDTPGLLVEMLRGPITGVTIHMDANDFIEADRGLLKAIDITFDFRSDTPPGRDPGSTASAHHLS